MRSLLVLVVTLAAVFLPAAECVYKPSTYNAYTMSAWVAPFNTYATQIKAYNKIVRTYATNLRNLIRGFVVNYGKVHHYGDEEMERMFGDLAQLDDLEPEMLADLEERS